MSEKHSTESIPTPIFPGTLRHADNIYRMVLMMMAGERHTRCEIIQAIAEEIEKACNG